MFPSRAAPTTMHLRRPIFRLVVLYVSEETSVARQLQRAKQLEKENAKVRDTGLGSLKTARATDVSEDLAKERYIVFKVRGGFGCLPPCSCPGSLS